ncbi:conserved hypothetical protein [Pediculus humanus corporis]|uniref:Uncharacterized protein n=1 Tax=Pediculus humanus subsp. corporis TaxID=121224 RepID=E0W1B3_PEDHC|nr:uncharacterized protein Phum_PHUM574120 [Pediculus humanus corporis]EEB19419.1 conserved hypothetical protein [Pediculus humanus corporis]
MKLQKWTFQVTYDDYNNNNRDNNHNNQYVNNNNNNRNTSPEYKLKRLKSTIIFLSERKLTSDEIFNEEINKINNNPLWNPTGKNIIMINLLKFNVNEEELSRKIIDKLWKLTKSTNNLIGIMNKRNQVNFYTWFPYKQPDCLKVNIIQHLDTYENDKFKYGDKNLFPEKLSSGNLNGCEIIAATDACIPYVFPRDEPDFRKKGIEMLLINTLSEKLNFKLNIMSFTDTGKTIINGTPVGIFEDLLEQKVDVAFSCLLLNQERYLLTQALQPYYHDSLVWFVPSPDIKTHASDLFKVFNYKVWLLIIFVMLFSSVFIVFLTSYENGNEIIRRRFRCYLSAFFNILKMSLSVSVNIKTKLFNYRLFIFFFYAYSIYISFYFEGSLFDLFKRPNLGHFYSSIEKAADDDEIFFYLFRSAENFYNQTNYKVWKKILKPERYTLTEDFGSAFREIAYKKKSVGLYIRVVGIYMVMVAYRDKNNFPKIFWLKEQFSMYPVTMYLSPGNPVFPYFQLYIHRILAAGLPQYWIQQTLYNVGYNFRKFGDYDQGPLTWKHLNENTKYTTHKTHTRTHKFISRRSIFEF